MIYFIIKNLKKMIYVTVAGNVGKDSELKEYNGIQVLSFSIASSKKLKGEEKTIWVNCNMWGEKAEKLKPYILKGISVICIGEAEVQSYINKEGNAVGTLQVNVKEFKFMGSPEKKEETSHLFNSAPATVRTQSIENNEFPF